MQKIPAQDREIIPAQPYVLGYAPQDVQGEKTFYSNGMVQDITTNTANGKVVHSFTAAGQLSAISIEENGTKKLVQYNNMGGEKLYSITESLGNNIDKTTTFTKDGSKNVIIENHSTEETRHAEYSKTGNLVWYSAHNPKVEEHFAIGFDETGKIQSVF